MNIEPEILAKCPLFMQIEPQSYSALLSCVNASEKTFSTNESVFLAGSQINYVGIVVKGSLSIIKESPAGQKHIIDFVGPSNLFGEGVVCTENRISPITVFAKENATVLMIPYERIIKTCGNSCSFHLQIIKNMMMLLGERNKVLNQKIELLALKGMREKLATYLLYESQKQKSNTFQIIPNRNELAEYLNVSRTSMSRELGRMKDLGMIDFYQNSFKILSKEKLSECLL